MLLTVATPATAQDSVPTLPDLSAEQRWTRADLLAYAWIAFAIRDARLRGRGTDGVVDAMMAVFGPTWPADLEPLGMLRAMHRNWLASPSATFELLQDGPEWYEARVNRPHLQVFGEGETFLDVTPEDFERLIGRFYARVSAERGMGYEQRIEGNWLYMRVWRN